MTLFKRTVAVILVFCLLVPVGELGLNAGASTQNISILRIHGELSIKRVGEDGQAYGLFDDGEYVKAIVDKALPYALTAFVTGDWRKWSEVAFAELKPATAILSAPHGTVEELEALGFRQFSWYTDPNTELIPLTADMSDEANIAKPATKNVFTAVTKWFRTLFRLIAELFNG